jgi:ankyrin repeat protein
LDFIKSSTKCSYWTLKYLGADFKDSIRNRTPLSWAAQQGHKAVVRLLVEREDVEVNTKDNWGLTPLSYAALHGQETVVRLIVEREDVKADSRDYRGQMPLFYAEVGENKAIVRLLLDQEDVKADSRYHSKGRRYSMR